MKVTCGRMLLKRAARNMLADDKITAYVKEICLLGVVCKVPNMLSGETFCFPEKCLLSILNFKLRVTNCFLRAADWPTTNFLGMYCYFSVIRLVHFVQVVPITVVVL